VNSEVVLALTGGGVGALGLLFTIAGIHKLRVLLTAGAWHNVAALLGRVGRRRTHEVLLVAVLLETSAICLLAWRPALGLLAVAALLLAYAHVLRRLPSRTSCQCFGVRRLDTTIGAAGARNVALALFALGVSILTPVEATLADLRLADTLAATMIWSSLIAGPSLLRQFEHVDKGETS